MRVPRYFRKNAVFAVISMAAFLLSVGFAGAEPAGTQEDAAFTKTRAGTLKRLRSLHRKAEKQVAMTDLRSALKTYDQIVLLEPDDETAYTNMGRCYMVLGDFARAEDAFQNALDINPENETALLAVLKIHNPDGQPGMNSIEPAPEPPPAVAEPATVPQPTKDASAQTKDAVWEIPSIDQLVVESEPPKDAAPPLMSSKEPMRVVMTPPAKVSAVVEEVPVEEPPTTQPAPAPASTELPPADRPANSVPVESMNFDQMTQQALSNLGLYKGPIDGIIGVDSVKAIKKFQRSRGLEADGKVGRKTWGLLETYLYAQAVTDTHGSPKN